MAKTLFARSSRRAQHQRQDSRVGAGGTAQHRLLRTQVGTEKIAEVVSRATGIPVSKMMQGEREKLLKMEDKLHSRVVGQDEAVRQMSGSDYQVIKLAVMGEVEMHFRPEFVNRIDEIVVFHALDEKNIAGIAKIQLRYLEKRMAKLDMTLDVSNAELALLAEAGFDPVFGARPIKGVGKINPTAKSERLAGGRNPALEPGINFAQCRLCQLRSATHARFGRPEHV